VEPQEGARNARARQNGRELPNRPGNGATPRRGGGGGGGGGLIKSVESDIGKRGGVSTRGKGQGQGHRKGKTFFSGAIKLRLEKKGAPLLIEQGGGQRSRRAGETAAGAVERGGHRSELQSGQGRKGGSGKG